MTSDLEKKEYLLKQRLKTNVILEQTNIFDVFDLFNVSYKGRVKQQLNCPFHADPTPSARVYPETDTFYCFQCHTPHNTISIASALSGLRYGETLDYLVEKLQLDISDKALQAKVKKVTDQGFVMASKAYREIEDLIKVMSVDYDVSIRRYGKLDKLFLGVDPNHQIYTSDFKKLISYVLA